MSSLTIDALEADIKKRERELAEAKAALEHAKKESPDKQLARELHSLLCTWNHTDGCGWFYEFKDKKDDWTGWAHGEYLKKAQRLIHKCNSQGCSPDQALELFRLVKGI